MANRRKQRLPVRPYQLTTNDFNVIEPHPSCVDIGMHKTVEWLCKRGWHVKLARLGDADETPWIHIWLKRVLDLRPYTTRVYRLFKEKKLLKPGVRIEGVYDPSTRPSPTASISIYGATDEILKRYVLCRSEMPNSLEITKEDWTLLARFFKRNQKSTLTLEDVQNDTGLSRELLLKVFVLAHKNRLGVMKLTFHHNCNVNEVLVRTAEEGLPTFPQDCPECGNRINGLAPTPGHEFFSSSAQLTPYGTIRCYYF